MLGFWRKLAIGSAVGATATFTTAAMANHEMNEREHRHASWYESMYGGSYHCEEREANGQTYMVCTKENVKQLDAPQN